jgi:hypothetical protein
MSGYIYIVKLREHVKTGEKIYKIGRTKDINRRFPQYPKGSHLIYCIYTEDVICKESEILQNLNEFICKEYGNEYFSCNLTYIKNIIDNSIILTDIIVKDTIENINIIKEENEIIINIKDKYTENNIDIIKTFI